MNLELVTSVPDLHTARILAAAGVPNIALSQDHPHFADIRSWLEGTKVGAMISEPESIIPQADFLVIPMAYFDQLSFLDHVKYWIKENKSIVLDPGGFNKDELNAFPSTPYFNKQDNGQKVWFDFEKNPELLESFQ